MYHRCKKYQTGFNHYPIHLPSLLSRPENYAGLASITSSNCAVRGLGSSYGDAALNNNGHLVLTERLERLLHFDEQQGILRAEAGISLTKILDVIVPRGWFLPVTPGTCKVSLGGCVAADVHGKNHRNSGSLGQHILELQLITADSQHVNCSPDTLPELFWATIGGMGLTGIIGIVTLRLKRIETAYMLTRYQTANNLEQTFEYLSQNTEDEYEVAWLDCLNLPLGRSIIMRARHADLSMLPAQQHDKPYLFPSTTPYKLPFHLPRGLLHPLLMKRFNRYNYRRLAKKISVLLPFKDYFYPLDRITHWPRLYGKCGFLQYQCVLPTSYAHSVIKQLIETLHTENFPIHLAVLKRFGRCNPSPLSFALPGFTLALDLPLYNRELFNCLDKLDTMVAAAGGRVYLVKDARLNPEMFRAMYPRYSDWLSVKQAWDPTNKFSSSLAKRLKIPN